MLAPGATTAEAAAPVPWPYLTVNEVTPSPVGVIFTIPELSVLMSKILATFAEVAELKNEVSSSIPSGVVQLIVTASNHTKLKINFMFFILFLYQLISIIWVLFD